MLPYPDKKAVEKTIKSVFDLLFPTTHSFTDIEIETIAMILRIRLLVYYPV